MQPCKFPQAIVTLKGPAGSGIGDLPTFTDGKTCLSCWKASWRERLIFLVTGKIWLWVWSGYTQPPVSLQVDPVEWRTPLSQPEPEPKKLGHEDLNRILGACCKRAVKQARWALLAVLLGGAVIQAAETRTLLWDPNDPAEQVTSYEVHQAVNGTNCVLLASTTNTTLTVQVEPGQYCWHVRARNSAGLSDPSSEVRETIRAPLVIPKPPGGLRIIASINDGPFSITVPATAGQLVGNVVIQDGTVLFPYTGTTNLGAASYTFEMPAGRYGVEMLVDAPSTAANSVLVAWNDDRVDIFDIPVTSGLQPRSVGLRGSGQDGNPEWPDAAWTLPAGLNQFLVVSREPTVRFSQVKVFSCE